MIIVWEEKRKKSKKLRKWVGAAGTMAQLNYLAKDWSLAPSTDARLLTVTFHSSSRRSDLLSFLCRQADTHPHTHHKQNLEIKENMDAYYAVHRWK